MADSAIHTAGAARSALKGALERDGRLLQQLVDVYTDTKAVNSLAKATAVGKSVIYAIKRGGGKARPHSKNVGRLADFFVSPARKIDTGLPPLFFELLSKVPGSASSVETTFLSGGPSVISSLSDLLEIPYTSPTDASGKMEQAIMSGPGDGRPLFGSVAQGGWTMQLLALVHAKSGSATRPLASISRLILRAMSPKLIKQLEPLGVLQPGFESQLAGNLQQIKELRIGSTNPKTGRRGTLEKVYWKRLPPFTGILYEDHACVFLWMVDDKGRIDVNIRQPRLISRAEHKVCFSCIKEIFTSGSWNDSGRCATAAP